MVAPKQYRRYRKIVDELVSRITSGVYAPGTRLPSERALVEDFQVSRPTLREALIALEIMGYVVVRGGSGIYVAKDGEHRAAHDPGIGSFELLEARKIIEADVAAIAATTITAEQLSELRLQLELQIKGLEENGFFSDDIDMQFHTLIARATGNGALFHVVQQLWRFRRESDIWRLIDERSDIKSMQTRAAEDHFKVFAALETRSANAAYDAMRQHMQNNIDWRLSGGHDIPAASDADRRTKLRLLLARAQIADAG